MSNLRREVSWLETFPPDIWAHFAWYIPGEHLGRLMLTGATSIWRRLKSPTVVKSIKLGTDFMTFESFPRFLNEFQSLEELTIHSCTEKWSQRLRLRIDLIPSGVRKVQLTGKWSSSAIETLFDDGKYVEPLKLTEHLPHLKILDLRSLEFDEYDWLIHLPQTLTQLAIFLWDPEVELPHSLLHLEADTGYVYSTSPFLRKLPTSLESFTIRSKLEGAGSAISLLPASVRKLRLHHVLLSSGRPDEEDIQRAQESPKTFLEQLPQDLTSFSARLDFRSFPELISYLPCTLTELELFSGFPSSAWCLLPPNLITLTLNAPQHYEIPKSIPFETLPKSITFLKLVKSSGASYFSGPPEIAGHSYFPPRLTYLSFPEIQLSPETAKLLPSSLTYLEIGNMCERVCEHLPNGLKTLKSSSTLMSPSLVDFLPKSLTYLQLNLRILPFSWCDYNTVEKVVTISKLPGYSMHEKCLSSSHDWKASSLGVALQCLYLDNAVGLVDSFLLHQRLPNLLELSLEHSKHFSDLCIPLLSTHLTTLNLGSSSKISGKSFENLPRSLTHLNLNTSESIFDSEIQHLPRTLKYSFLKAAIHLTDLCLPHLPPQLEKLCLQKNTKITKSSFAYFPSTLRSSQLSETVELAKWKINWGAVCEM